jgi:hypothetical protein
MSEEDDEAAYRRSLAGLAVAIVVVVIGLWLVHAWYENLQHERCVEERRICDPIPLDGSQ